MKSSPTIGLIMPALITVIGTIEKIKQDRQNDFLKSKYATLDAILYQAKPLLLANKMTVFQPIDNEGVETIIVHESGEWLASGKLKITPQDAKGLSYAQSYGIATTYAKRYQLGGMLSIVTEEDTDGNHGNNKGLAPVGQANNQSSYDQEAQRQIILLNSVDELQKYWNDNKEYHKDKAFKATIEKRKFELIRGDKKNERKIALLDNCRDLEALEALKAQNSDWPSMFFEMRAKELQKK